MTAVMVLRFVPFALLQVSASFILLGLAVIIRSRDSVPGRRYIVSYLTAISWWTFANAVEASLVSQSGKIIWNQIGYMGFVCAAPLLFLFTNDYLHQQKLSRFRQMTLWTIPGITVVLAWTNARHHWMWTGFTPGPSGTNLLVYHHGPWFWVIVGYSYLVILVTILELFQAFLHSATPYRWQIGVLLLGTFFPILTATFYLLNWQPVPGMDTSSSGFILTGLVIGWGMMRLRLFELIPVARDLLIESMQDGLLVLDEKGALIELNPAASRLMRVETCHIGQKVEALTKHFPELTPICNTVSLWSNSNRPKRHDDRAGVQSEFRTLSSPPRAINLQAIPLFNRESRFAGSLILLHDVTVFRSSEEALHQANKMLQEKLMENETLQIKLHEQATRDALTGLFNRHYLNETLAREFARAQREHYPVGLVMLDIDHFKMVNDTYGHKAGDLVLQSLGAQLRQHIRASDIACRYGGEEFLLVISNTPANIIYKRAEQLRGAFDESVVKWKSAEIKTTISLGIAVFPDHGQNCDEVLLAADQAMYTAKLEGRNRVVVFEPIKGGRESATRSGCERM